MDYKQKFINQILPAALEGYKEYNILPSLTLAQAVLESGWGKNHIENNLFGFKANKSWKGKVAVRKTKEWNGKKYVIIEARFKAYDSFQDSIRDHNKLLGTASRYASVRVSKDYKEACRAVWRAGYATDTKYPEKLIRIIEENDFMQYDKQSKEHWGEHPYNNLAKKGIKFSEKRFDDKLTRAEAFEIADKLTDWVNKKIK